MRQTIIKTFQRFENIGAITVKPTVIWLSHSLIICIPFYTLAAFEHIFVTFSDCFTAHSFNNIMSIRGKTKKSFENSHPKLERRNAWKGNGNTEWRMSNDALDWRKAGLGGDVDEVRCRESKGRWVPVVWNEVVNGRKDEWWLYMDRES